MGCCENFDWRILAFCALPCERTLLRSGCGRLTDLLGCCKPAAGSLTRAPPTTELSEREPTADGHSWLVQRLGPAGPSGSLVRRASFTVGSGCRAIADPRDSHRRRHSGAATMLPMTSLQRLHECKRRVECVRTTPCQDDHRGYTYEQPLRGAYMADGEAQVTTEAQIKNSGLF